jgi:hypothetical protein
MAVQPTQPQSRRVARLAREIAELSEEERRELEGLVQESVGTPTTGDRPHGEYRITQLRGLGKEYWAGIDVDEYVRQERASWDS